MAAPKGNRFWEARTKHGRDKLFQTPEILAEACAEYFEWVEGNPLWEAKAFKVGDEIVVEKLPKMRAMTVTGLCNFLDISQETWWQYAKQEGYSDIASRVMDGIRQQKFEGASADLLNANIIARDLGLADRKEHTGKDGGAIKTEEVGSGAAKLTHFLDGIAKRSAADSGSAE